ncbi:MAG: hypothetical protein HYY21_02485 [Candidatus Tectomicrobia bacterium]|nr:hypothetical protein [Candidatus Tectomicrobia bacterium]
MGSSKKFRSSIVFLLPLCLLLSWGLGNLISPNAAAAQDLTGVWRGNDGGTYYIRQVGSRLYWLGESGDGGRTWTNVAIGPISGNQISLEWGDVTKGRIRNSGQLAIRINNPDHLVRTGVTGGFGGSEWRRVGAPPPPPAGFDLTGVWRGNDGGTYYIRQVGSRLYWLGESGDGGRTWTNVAIGPVSGAQITLEWGDVTKGRIRNSGQLAIRVDNPNHLVRTGVTGGFGGSEWRR